jgi:glycosyltransferase involved in cell wall biosynthesis
VLASIYEPFGISLCEAMIYGLPCVTVDRCAMQEIVLDGETGVVARAEDSRSLADSMLEIARHPNEARCMGMAGRERALSNFTWDAVARKIIRVTKNLDATS